VSKRIAALAFAAALSGCQGMADWRPADGRPITREEQDWTIQECKRQVGEADSPWAWERRDQYADCMRELGWVAGEPILAPSPRPVSAPGADAADVCGARVQAAIRRGQTGDELDRVLNECMAEHGR